MSNKTISINPSLFSMSKSKTKKNREKMNPKPIPIISPNVLKNKLLKRIKEHKQNETQDLDSQKKRLPKPVIDKASTDAISYSDEFNDSLHYLQSLSKQKQINEEKQRLKDDLERRTIRNYHSLNSSSPIVNIDLPDDLVQTTIQPPSNHAEPFKIHTPYKGDNVPYGVLKGGLKPSYREWSKTQRNGVVTNPSASLILPSVKTQEISSRENRLQKLKDKIKQKELENKQQTDFIISNTYSNPLSNPVSNNNNNSLSNNNNNSLSNNNNNSLSNNNNNSLSNNNNNSLSNNNNNNFLSNNNAVSDNIIIKPNANPTLIVSPINQNVNVEHKQGNIIATRHITKKTIKRKYTLGKSDIKRKVAILIKDRGTRKQILTAQKELKRRNINDIKLYLRDHNLIKVGTNAPNDVLRKMYESAMLTGEVTNNNADTLLHNLGNS